MATPMSPWALRIQRWIVVPAVTAVAAVAAWAAEPPPDTSPVVAEFDHRQIRVSEVERQIADTPPFQLRVLGATPDQIRKRFLDVLIDSNVLAAGAVAEGLDRTTDVAERRRSLLATALLASIRREVGDGSDIPEAELKAFFEANKERYQGDRAIQLWQIVVDDRDQAVALIADLHNDPEAKKDPARRWGELAERHSVDESTKNRQGNLGFVRPDGATDRPGERVSRALYDAADKVADGEIVPEPVAVGDRWVVLQRRAKRDRPNVGFEVLEGHLRAQILQQRIEERIADLKKTLRSRADVEIHPDLVDHLEVSRELEGEIVAARRPGGMPRDRRAAAAPPRPAGPPGQLR